MKKSEKNTKNYVVVTVHREGFLLVRRHRLRM